MIGAKNIFWKCKKRKILDIWKQKYERARKQLLNSNRNFNPCKKCDVEGV